MGIRCFLQAHLKVLFKIEKKLKREIMHHFWMKMPMCNKLIHGYISSHHLFFFFFFSGCCLPLLLFFPSSFLSFCFFFFWFIGQACPIFFFFLLFFFSFSFSFFFCLDVIFFFYGNDFYFLINLGDWFFLLVYHFFCFNWTSFFNKGIHVNLYKLIVSIPSFFHSQPNKKKGN